MLYNGDYYRFKGKHYMRNPIYALEKNGIKAGEVNVTRKIAFGPGSLFRIKFNNEEDDSNLLQIVFFLVNYFELNR